MYGITLGFALASIGFGLFRPGFTSGASLAVRRDEQNAVAGMVTSVNGVAYIAAPALGVLLYGMWMPLPFVVTAVGLVAAGPVGVGEGEELAFPGDGRGPVTAAEGAGSRPSPGSSKPVTA